MPMPCLGLDLERVWEAPPAAGAEAASDPASLPEDAAALVSERSAARTARDFARADALRDQLAAMGIDLVDRPDGTTEVRRR